MRHGILPLTNIVFPSLFLSSFLLFAAEKPRRVIICEHEKGIISCQNGKRIDVLNATYGRLNRDTCNKGVTDNINCHSEKSLQIVQEKCNGQTSCELLVNNTVFGGDPCVKTNKYLNVKYRCLEYIGK